MTERTRQIDIPCRKTNQVGPITISLERTPQIIPCPVLNREHNQKGSPTTLIGRLQKVFPGREISVFLHKEGSYTRAHIYCNACGFESTPLFED